MSAVSLPHKPKIFPLNLTSEAVHYILKDSPVKLPTYKKIYPTANYRSEDARFNTQLQVGKKLKELDRIICLANKPKGLGENCKVTNDNEFVLVRRGSKKYSMKNEGSMQKDYSSHFFQPKDTLEAERQAWKRSTEKYFEKVSKIKNMKLRQYMKNKFVFEAKAIESTRENQKLKNETISKKNSIDQIQKKTKAHRRKYDSQIETLNKSKSIEVEINHQQNPESYNESKMLSSSGGVIGSDKMQEFSHKKNKAQKVFKLEKSCLVVKRDVEEHPFLIRFQRMRNHINFILLSFGCQHEMAYKDLPPYSRNLPKYKFYVGPGNNKNLIVSVMKKKWWWSETSSIAEANFVWTQLKQNKVLRELKKVNNSLKKPVHKKDVVIVNSFVNKNKKLVNNIFHPQSGLRFEQQPIYSSQKSNVCQMKAPQKIHNHYQGNSNIGNKKALFHYISEYCQWKEMNRYDYIPLTFHIESKKCSELKKLQKSMRQNVGSFWLVKPGQNSNRGNGISIVKSYSEVEAKIKCLNSGTLIIQKYIENLFLFNCRKFDIRTYMIAVTIKGSTKYYWYNEGYLRTSSYIFNLNNYDDILIHLTNDAIQCGDENYSKYEEGNKVSYKQFQRYLDEKYPKKSYSIQQAHNEMKNIAKIAISATYPQLNYSGLQYSFEVFGLDFIIDSSFKPWLIEVNTNPCLELSSSCLERLIPQMIENTLRLALDTVYQPSMQYPRTMGSYVPENVLASNRFCIVYDDVYDREDEWEKIIGGSQAENYEGEEEEFEGDGNIIEV